MNSNGRITYTDPRNVLSKASIADTLPLANKPEGTTQAVAVAGDVAVAGGDSVCCAGRTLAYLALCYCPSCYSFLLVLMGWSSSIWSWWCGGGGGGGGRSCWCYGSCGCITGGGSVVRH